MKKISLLLILTVPFFALKAQNKTIVPIVAQASDYISLIENNYNQQVVHLEFDVIKSEKTIYRQLFAGTMYGIIIYGDDQIKELKLKIEHIEGEKVISDVVSGDGKGIVMLYFKPKVTDYYSFTITSILNNPDDYGYYGCIIFR